jgi:hypothetical protein
MTENYDSELISYNKLIDVEISTAVKTLDYTSQVNPKERTAEISFLVEEANNGEFNKENRKYTTKVEIEEATLYNLQYKLKSAVNQIQDVVKNYGNY